MKNPFRWSFGVLASIFVGLSACGGGDDPQKPDPEVQKASITSFAVLPEVAAAGDEVTATWATANADSIALTANGAPVDLGDAPAAEGSARWTVRETTAFVLEATGAKGDKVTANATVTVEDETPAVKVLAFAADPSTLDDAGETTLSWKTENAESIRIARASGGELDLEGKDPAEGSVVVTVGGTESFTLVAQRGADKAERAVTVTVKGSPLASLTIDPRQIEFGADATIAWETTDAVALTITDADGMELEGPLPASGTRTISPEFTTTYTLTAMGAAEKKAIVSAEIEVTPAILAFAAIDPSPAGVGDAKVLTWKTGGAHTVEISNLDGATETFSGTEALDGSASLPLGAEGTFRIVARSGSLEAEQEIRIDVVDDPTIASFEADADVVSLVDGVATVSLSWTGVARAERLELVGDTTGPIDLTGLDLVADSIEIEIESDTTFTLTAHNVAGFATKSIDVRAVPLPAVDSFTVLPAYVGPGEEVELAWETTDATNVVILQNGIELEGPHATSGTLLVEVAVSSTFEIIAYNDALDSDSKTESVTVGAPQIATFEVSSNHVWLGAGVEFSWETLGGTELTLSAGGAVIHSTAIRSEIEQGATLPIVMDEVGTFTFTLEVKNASGQTRTQTAVIQVSSGPAIASFSVAPQALLAGSQITVTWAATPDPDGAVPELSLTGTRGGPYALPEGSSGTTSFALTEVGGYDFTLTASTSSAGSTPATSSQSVTVYGQPSVTLVADPLKFDDDVHPGVTLTWTSANADQSLQIFTVDAGVQDLLFDVPAADRAGGSWLAPAPAAATTYRIVATNGLSMQVQAEAQVTLQGAEIITFTATPPVYPTPPDAPAIGVVAGDEVLLEWTTRKADTVALSILSGLTFSETSEPYLDVAGSGGTKFPFTTATWCCDFGDEGQEVLNFPAGFVFPFGGVGRTQAMIYANGFISFDTSVLRNSTGFQNAAFPASNRAWAHLAVFWDDLKHYGTPDEGNVYWMQGTDAKGAFLAIEWKSFGFANNVTADLNFEMILRETGEFEYRYGTMAPISASLGLTQGNSATIGYQLPGQTEYHLFSNNTAVPGGLENRSFIYALPPSLDPNGSYAWNPIGGAGVTNRTVTLSARHSNGNDSEALTVEVHPRATVGLTAPEWVVDGDDVTIAWTSTNATSVEVVDGLGSSRCTASPGQVATGSCTLTEPTLGPKEYTVTATGALGHTVSKSITTYVVSEDFGITSFEADEAAIDWSDSVTLSWVTGDAETMRILANGVELALPGTIDLAQDSILVTPPVTTTYELVIGNSLFGTRSRTVTVVVRSATIELTTSATDVVPGQPVTITWAGASLDGGPVTVEVPFLQMVEDTAGPGFQDISQEPDVVTLIDGGKDTTAINHTLAGDFVFPFRGVEYTALRVATDGYLSFDSSTTSTGSNQIIPSTDSTRRRASLAAFWDDLHTRASGRVYAGLVGGDYIVQWTGMSPTTASSNTDEWNLNFQIVLHADGSFEYRYGTMAPRATSSTSCYPDTCVNEANGSSATIGYQNAAGTEGALLHFGGTSNGAGNSPFQGGLEGRTFRYDPPEATGSTTFTPRASGDYTVCVSQDGYRRCETIRVDAEFKIESFDVSASDIEWGETIDFTWATKGAETLAIKNGSTVVVDETTVPVAAGSYTHQPAGTATYTLEARNSFLNQTLTATKTVSVKQFELSLEASTVAAEPGDPVALTWDATMLSGGNMVLTTPMAEVTGTVGFTDISTEAGVHTLHLGSIDDAVTAHTFDGGFTFTYLGTEYDSVRVSSNGFLSFDSGATSVAANTAMPTTSTSEKRVHIAPFWDDLNTRSPGRVYAALVGSDYVIQWSHVSNHAGSSSNPMDLNFQVVLHPDGSFDYVYGIMAGLTAPNTSTSCHPSPGNCENEANGSSATIGYQDPSGVAGYQLHFGGSSNGASNVPFAGGLSGRAFRFVPWNGSGSMMVNPTDPTSYEICAISGSFVECSEPVEVKAEWAILAFTAAPSLVIPGDLTELVWDTKGGNVDIIAKSGGTDRPLSASGPAGSITDTPDGNTTYTLVLESLGRIKTATATTTARNVEVDLTVSQETVLAGETATLSWDVIAHTSGNLVVASPMGDASGPGMSFADLDISANPAADVLHGASKDDERYTLNFPSGFSFPYLGTDRTTAQVSVNGFLTFDTSSTAGRWTNAAIPTTDSTNKTIHIAPFWDDVKTQTSGRVLGMLVDQDTYVVQWSHVSLNAGSSTTAEYDLNFMVVLHSDGRFEYRYGTMAPPATPSGTSCGPTTCVNETMGSSATIGYQDPTGTMGYQVHFGGSNSASNPVVAGGLAGRTFVYDPALSGSVTVSPSASTTYKICAQLDGYKECKDVAVTVPTAGSLTISELAIAGAPGEQWFEVKNLSGVPLDLEGWTIETNGGPHTIAGPVVVPVGGFATFAASVAVDFTPDYVFGAGLTFDPAADTLALKAGTATVSSVTWGGTWTHPAGGTLALDGTFFMPGVVSNDDPTRWCTGAPSPGSLGVGCKNAYYSLDRFSQVPFIDISATGTPVAALLADGGTAEIPVPFSMPYWDTTVTKIWANSNGWISFAPTAPSNTHFAPETLPRSGTASPAGPLVAAFWEDLGCSQAAPGMSFQYEQRAVGAQTVTILQWNNFKRCSNDGGTTFQAQLWSNGDVAIVFDRFAGANADAQAIYSGKQAWIALEAPNRTDFLTALFRQPTLVSGQAILFKRK